MYIYICIYIYLNICAACIYNLFNLTNGRHMREKCSLTPNLKRMRAIHPGIFGGDDGSGEYSKCVALPMVTWARVGLDMRNRDFLRNSAAANGAAARQPA